MKNPIFRITRTIVALLPICVLTATAAPMGAAFTYQGRLTDGGAPANGAYELIFSLYPVGDGGAAIAGPVTNSPVVISNGLFSVVLDFGSGVFDGNACFLQIGTRTNGGGPFTDLTPRQPLTPAPYAIYASTSPVASNSVNAASLVDGSITSADLGPNSVNSGHIIDGQVGNADLANNAVNSAKVQDGTLVGVDLANNTVSSTQLADSITLGDAATTGALTIYRVAGGGPAINLSSINGGYINVFQDDGQVGILLDGDSGGGGLQYVYAADGSVGITLDGESGGAGLISVLNTNGSTRLSLDGAGSGSGGQISVSAQDGSTTVQLFGESGGAGLINVNNNLSATRVAIDGEGNGSGGQINLYTSGGGDGITLYGDSGGGGLQYIYNAAGSIGMSFDGESGGAGFLSVRNTNSSTRVALDGYNSTTGSGEISVYHAGGGETVEILGGESTTSGGQILMRNFAGANTIQLDSDASGNGSGYLQLYKSDGTATITLQADLAGDGRITTQELQITGGSDLSEQFDIGNATETIIPGALVSIDPQHPGKLKLSSQAYDRTVAGVVSGAGGVKTGMMMGQRGSVADGKHPVALTGRVFCLVTAEQGAIQPGDLITTSDVAGHGMKVADHGRSHGAIIGKAMTGLEEGKGLVLVLVSLQ